METPALTTEQDDFIPIPGQSAASFVLNGAGNGMMLGALPFVAHQLYDRVINKTPAVESKAGTAYFALTAAGCVLGAIYGAHEAKQVNTYRESVSGHLRSLYKRVEKIHPHREKWADKVAAEPAADAIER